MLQSANQSSHQLSANETSAGMEFLRKVLLASVYDVAVETELTSMSKLSTQLGQSIYLKREDQQVVQSFKIRGAYNKLSGLLKQSGNTGSIKEVVAASAGNHAQGLALAAKKLGIKATIFMPITTPAIKVDNVRQLGGNVKLTGKNFDQAQEQSLEYAKHRQLEVIPPFDDLDVIAGQGTIGKELIQQLPDCDVVFIPVGGGGLLAGIATFIKQLKPSIKIIGVEAEDSACLKAALSANHPVDLDQVGLFADGVAVKRIGEKTFELIRQYCDDVITVNSDEICTAIKDIFEQTRVIAEPAGALSLAGLKKNNQQKNIAGGLKPEKQVAILSGANMSFHNLRYVSERCELGEKKEAVFSVTIPEVKGSFKTFCSCLEGRPITEFNYRYCQKTNSSENNKQAHIFVGVRLSSNPNERSTLVNKLLDEGYHVEDLSENELAKLHIRHMIGGSGSPPKNERIFQFQFPEYPGALEQFLDTLGEHWNISLFHYRNHGAAYGQVLAGFQVAKNQQLEFFRHIKRLGYQWTEETDNPAYKSFLVS
jgi:threonine dehydratase